MIPEGRRVSGVLVYTYDVIEQKGDLIVEVVLSLTEN